VTLYLPRTMEQATAAQSSAEVQAEAMGRLLLVEDNPYVADATGSMLLQLGYDSHPCTKRERRAFRNKDGSV
jgi:hypothetical protein